MKIEGLLIKSKNWWAVEMPLPMIYTQGRTKKEALEMAKDAIEGVIGAAGFSVEVKLGDNNKFSVSASDDTLLMAFVLKQHRRAHGLSIREVAKRLGSKYPNAYSQYERGKVKPSLDKFSKIMTAIDPSCEPVMTL